MNALIVALICLVGEQPVSEPLVLAKGDRFEVKVIAVEDLDRVTVRSGNRQASVALAAVLPLSHWPAGSEAQRAKAKSVVDAVMKGQALFLEVRSIATAQRSAVVDLSFTNGATWDKTPWNAERPSGKFGWGMTNVNLLLIEKGASPFVKEDGANPRERKWVEELFPAAEQIARNEKAGFWATAALAESLKKPPGDK